LNYFIPAAEKRFGEVERRVEEEVTSWQASMAEIRKVEEYIQHQVEK